MAMARKGESFVSRVWEVGLGVPCLHLRRFPQLNKDLVSRELNPGGSGRARFRTMQLVPGPMASCSALPTLFVPWDRTEATISFLVFTKGGAFWSCGHLPSVNPKYQASSPDRSQGTPSSGDTVRPPLWRC